MMQGWGGDCMSASRAHHIRALAAVLVGGLRDRFAGLLGGRAKVLERKIPVSLLLSIEGRQQPLRLWMPVCRSPPDALGRDGALCGFAAPVGVGQGDRFTLWLRGWCDRLCCNVCLASVNAGAGRFAVSLQAVAKAAFAIRIRVRVSGPIGDVGRAHASPPMFPSTGRNVIATTHGLLDQGARSAFRLSQRVAKLFRALPQHCVVGIM